VRVLAWNLNRGRAAEAWSALARTQRADGVLLQETPPPSAVPAQYWEPVPHRLSFPIIWARLLNRAESRA